MNKSRYFLIILIIISSLFFLAGCKRITENGGDPTQQQVTLIWWNLFESEENVKPLIEAFQNANPNVVIQYKQQGITGGVNAYKNLLDNALNDEDKINDPDIFTIENTWVGNYTEHISPAPQEVISAEFMTDFYPIIQNDFAKNAMLGVPLYIDTLAVIYNRDKLIGSGYTLPSMEWSEFKTQALNMTTRDSAGKILTSGFSAGYGSNAQFNFDLFSLLMMQNGVRLDEPTVLSSFSTNPDVLESFEFVRTFSDRTGSWDKDQKLDVSVFLENRLAMYIAPSWRLNDILIYNEQYNLGLDIGVAPLPQLSGTDTTHFGTYWGQTVAKESPNSKVAWEFIKFITEPQQLKKLDETVKSKGRKVGIFYPRLSMASDITNDPNLRVFAQSAPFAKSWFMYDGYAVEEEFNKFFNEDERDLKKLETFLTTTVKVN